MTIAAGETAPVFSVLDSERGTRSDGASPTKPWTAVCLAQRLGTRISGPLFFGFSDPVTQRALAQLYTPEELAAARRGSTVDSAQPSDAELCAKELRSAIECLGERTSLALALTKQLLPGGERLGGVEELKTFARSDGGAALSRFLTTSSELSEATRRWPIWASVFVPKIIAQLLPPADEPATPQLLAEEAPPRAAVSRSGRKTGRSGALLSL
jgi:hypothetical protein